VAMLHLVRFEMTPNDSEISAAIDWFIISKNLSVSSVAPPMLLLQDPCETCVVTNIVGSLGVRLFGALDKFKWANCQDLHTSAVGLLSHTAVAELHCSFCNQADCSHGARSYCIRSFGEKGLGAQAFNLVQSG
jgi:hypothetical protein